MTEVNWKKTCRKYHLETRAAWRTAMRNTTKPENVDRYIEALTTQLDILSNCLNDTPAETANYHHSIESKPVSLFARSDFVRG